MKSMSCKKTKPLKSGFFAFGITFGITFFVIVMISKFRLQRAIIKKARFKRA
jgi:hypothetical protein